MKKIIFLLLIVHCVLNIENCMCQWVQMSNGLPSDKRINAITVLGNNIFVAPKVSNVFVSSNNGSNWSSTSLNVRIISFTLLGNTIFAGAVDATNNCGVYLSSNNGVNWIRTSLHDTIASLATLGNNVFAGTYGRGLFTSTNNGASWTQNAFNGQMIPSLAVSGNNIYAGTYLNGLYYSTNNGSNWIQTSLNNLYIFSLGVNGDNILTGTNNGLFITTNHGTNWTQTNSYYAISFAFSGNTILLGTEYHPSYYTWGVYTSTNKGANWIQKNEGLTNNITGLAFLIYNNNIFLGTNDIVNLWRRPLSDLGIGIKNISTEIPSAYSLLQNYPNPFNPSTNVQFSIPNVQFVTLKVFDMLGKEVATLVNEKLKAGTYEATFDGSNLPSGIYFYKLETENFSDVKKMVLVK